MNDKQYKHAKASTLRAIFVDKMKYNEVSAMIKTKFGFNYEEVAYRMDEEGVFQ